jgi:parallel beta-helix repeat protein
MADFIIASEDGTNAVVSTATPTDFVIDGTLRGEPGLSAYEIWLAEGNTGTIDDFLDSIGGSGAHTADFIVAPYGSSAKADYYVQSATHAEVEINQAIDAASALDEGGSVYLVSGFYGKSNDPIIPRDNVKLYSDGHATIRNTEGWGVGVPADQIDAATIIQDDGNAFDDFEVNGIRFIGNRTLGSTSCAIHLSGSGDINNPGAPEIGKVTIRNCAFEHMQLLPVKIFGCGVVETSGCWFEDNADPGYGFNEEVRFINNHSKDSHDNGVSLSRGNGKVVCVGNTIEDPTLYGIWMGGYNGDPGPHEFTCTGNVVIGSRRSCITLEGAPMNGVVAGNYLEHSGERPTDSHQDGIEIYGDSALQRAQNITVTGNTIKYAPRSGVSVNNADNITITGNMIIDVGTEFLADGTTTILSTDTTTNVGILSTALNNTNIWIDGNSIIDTRATKLTNWDIWKTEGTASGFKVGVNYSSGMRNERNRIEAYNTEAETGQDINRDINGPDANINLNYNMQGTGANAVFCFCIFYHKAVFWRTPGEFTRFDRNCPCVGQYALSVDNGVFHQLGRCKIPEYVSEIF